eukprot:SM000427S15756  [mRNA]  locus=s427:9908:14784:+ [translate_table: standard]
MCRARLRGPSAMAAHLSLGRLSPARLWTAAGLTSLLLLLLCPLCLAPPLGLLRRLPAVDALFGVKQQLVDPGQKLESWDPGLDNPCTWFHVTCSNDLVTRLDLSKSNLSGTLDPSIALLPQLQYLSLYNNSLSGPLPSELGNLTNLISLEVEDNMFSGPIPASLGQLPGLKFLKLDQNNFSGSIPTSLNSLPLQVLNLAYNNLSGSVPTNGTLGKFGSLPFVGNPNLCGGSIGLKLCPGEKLSPPPPPGAPPAAAPSPAPSSSGGGSGSIGAVVGAVVGATLAAIALSILVYCYMRKRKPPLEKDMEYGYFDNDPDTHLGQLKRYAFKDLYVACNAFDEKNVLGKGGFGKVYKGKLDNGTLVAVKRLKEERSAGGEHQFQTEVELISMAVHRNLLRLYGFCITQKERLLVYPLMSNGSVASRLQEREASQPPLEWARRKKIAIGAARGLAYLHDHCDPKIIHRDVKVRSSQIDATSDISHNYLSTGKSSEKTDVFGYGIMLLELMTGQRAFDLARIANDEDAMLLDWVKGLLREGQIHQLVDKDLKEGEYNVVDVEQMIQVALLCTQGTPAERPKMAECVRMLEGDGLAERWEEWQKVEVIRGQDPNFMLHMRPSDWAVDSEESFIRAVDLSGPR